MSKQKPAAFSANFKTNPNSPKNKQQTAEQTNIKYKQMATSNHQAIHNLK